MTSICWLLASCIVIYSLALNSTMFCQVNFIASLLEMFFYLVKIVVSLFNVTYLLTSDLIEEDVHLGGIVGYS